MKYDGYMNEPLPERPLTGEPLALDLVNTEWIEAGTPHDLLALPGGMEQWLDSHGFSPPSDREAARRALENVRSALRRCLETDDADSGARHALNEILAEGRIVPFLQMEGAGESVEVEPALRPAWATARNYLELRGQWPRWRVRACAHPDCILYFLDTTRNGTRRWCDMRTCGNRAKARRYQQRHRE